MAGLRGCRDRQDRSALLEMFRKVANVGAETGAMTEDAGHKCQNCIHDIRLIGGSRRFLSS